MADAITALRRIIRPLIPVGYFEYATRRQYLTNARRQTRADAAGGPAESPAAAMTAHRKRTALILYWSHGYGVVELLTRVLANALSLRQFEVSAVNIGNQRALEVLAESGGKFDIAVSVGGPPLAAGAGGRPVFEAFGDVFYFYGLDAITNDLMRMGAVQRYWQAAQRSARLRFLFPDRGYCRIIGDALTPSQSLYFPFGGYYDAMPGPGRAPARQSRLAVVGTIGSELAEISTDDGLAAVIDADRAAKLAPAQRDDLVAAVQRVGGPTNVAAVAQAVLGVDPRRLLSNEFVPLLAAIDSFEKRRRRLLVVKRLAGLPVDFFGSGWERYVEPGETFRFAGHVHFAEIGRLSRQYAGLVNFDPNWDDGMHDRAYTALGNGCRVLTNVSSALADVERPNGAVSTYDANSPDVREAAAAILAAPEMEMTDIMRMRRNNDWLGRVDALLHEIF